MWNRIISGSLFALLLIALLVPPLSILAKNNLFQVCKSHFVSDDTCFELGCDEEQEVLEKNLGKARIVERKISESELEELKMCIGVYKEDESNHQTTDNHGTGWRPPTEEEWTQIMENAYIVDKVLPDKTVQSPSAVDHTTKPWFPPIGDQDGEGSCTCWAVGYYMKTFQEAKEHNWNLSGAIWEDGQPTVEYQDRIISPDFIYHLINDGVDNGSGPYTAINLICSIGASSWETMPYDPDDSVTWPSEEAWQEAPLYRGDSYELMRVNDDDELTSLKNWIASDNLAATTVDSTKIYNGLWSLLTSKDMLTLDNYDLPISLNHEVAIVGYDDNFEYTEQGQTRYGAFKIANSWGIGGLMGWENVPDGCFWISYEAMKQRVGFCEFYHDRISYEPELVASFRIEHSKRNECDITVGIGSQTKLFNEYVYGGDQPFCSNNILFDITEFKDALPTVYNQEFFLQVYDGESSTTGTIDKFGIEYEESEDTPLLTEDQEHVYAYVTLTPLGLSEQLVNTDMDFVDSKTSMATDSNGYLYIAYEDWYPLGDRYGIFVQRSTNGGNTWSDLFHFYYVSYECHAPSIAIDPNDNKVYVAYERVHPGSDHDIYCCVYTHGSGQVHVGVDTDNGDDRNPSITSEYQYGSTCWQYISYEYVHTYNDRDLMFAKSTDHGATWSLKKLHGDWPDYNVHAQTCITNAEGYIYIAYKWGADYDSACEIRVERSTDFGDSWIQYADIDGSLNDCCFPSVAATHGGSTVLVAFQYAWSETDDDIRYSYSADKGESWNKGLFLFGSLENERRPVVAIDGEGMTGNDIGGYFYVVCRNRGYIEYRKTHCSSPYTWSNAVLVSERLVGNGLAVTTQFRSRTGKFRPCIAWSDARTKDVYYSAVCEVHNLNTGLTYGSIQEAINADETTDGDTIFVEPKAYYEKVVLNKSVSLIGEDKENTIIDGNPGYGGIMVDVVANNTVLRNFTIRNGNFGIYIHECSNATVENNIVTNNECWGISPYYHSSNNTILGNNVTLNGQFGIFISASSNNVFKNNHMSANKYNFGVNGFELSEYIHDVDSSNTVNGKPVYYLVNGEDLLIDNSTFPDIGFLGIINSINVTVQNVDLKENNNNGLLFAYTNDSFIMNNDIANNNVGIVLVNSLNIDVYGNSITESTCGVLARQSSGNHIFGNSMRNNSNGIQLWSSSYNSLCGNNITGNECGINLYDSSSNSIYHNNFMENEEQVYDASKDWPVSPSINTWDNGYSSGGNYWSDYVGVDLFIGPYQNVTGGDGIGDTPYVIDINNINRYPLMKPYAGPHDVGIGSFETSKTVVGQGYNVNMTTTIINYGEQTETFNLTIQANSTTLYTLTQTLTSRNSTIVTFTWNTTDWIKGNYTISAYVAPVPGETDLSDNNSTGGWVFVTIQGDVDGDRDVDIYDVIKITGIYHSKRGDPQFNPNSDLDDDGEIKIYDVVRCTSHYGQSW